MPFISITTWPLPSDEKATALIEAVTDVVAKTTGAPLNKIAVVIHEVPQARWGEAGVMATNAEFASLSCRTSK
ncbi:tautomerase family protein [Alcaligenes sp.]|uniref:tautomerase family protein n=1 Tax=Alcaligenes sp. TaxID=512 RepID=UPI003B6CB08C|nr:tautomerase family protein [Klebsiella pneumoniae]